MTVDPSKRGRLKDVTKDLWVNMGQGEQLRPYREPSCDDRDPRVTRVTANMGYGWDQTQDSLTGWRFDHVMATSLL